MSDFPASLLVQVEEKRRHNVELSSFVHGYHNYSPVHAPIKVEGVGQEDFTYPTYVTKAKSEDPEVIPFYEVSKAPPPPSVAEVRWNTAQKRLRNIELSNLLHGYQDYATTRSLQQDTYQNDATSSENQPPTYEQNHKSSPLYVRSTEETNPDQVKNSKSLPPVQAASKNKSESDNFQVPQTRTTGPLQSPTAAMRAAFFTNNRSVSVPEAAETHTANFPVSPANANQSPELVPSSLVKTEDVIPETHQNGNLDPQKGDELEEEKLDEKESALTNDDDDEPKGILATLMEKVTGSFFALGSASPCDFENDDGDVWENNSSSVDETASLGEVCADYQGKLEEPSPSLLNMLYGKVCEAWAGENDEPLLAEATMVKNQNGVLGNGKFNGHRSLVDGGLPVTSPGLFKSGST